MSIINKNIGNSNGLSKYGKATIDKIDTKNLYEYKTAAAGSSGTYLLDYNLGSVFYIYEDQLTGYNSNNYFNINIINLPTDLINKIYTITLIYKQSSLSTQLYCKNVYASDITSNNIIGSYGSPVTVSLINGTTNNVINAQANLTIQNFNIFSLSTSTGTTTNYCTSSIGYYY